MNKDGMASVDEDNHDQEDPELSRGSLLDGNQQRLQNLDIDAKITVAIDDFMRSPKSAT